MKPLIIITIWSLCFFSCSIKKQKEITHNESGLSTKTVKTQIKATNKDSLNSIDSSLTKTNICNCNETINRPKRTAQLRIFEHKFNLESLKT